jgi:eukaryotic-like serine/threonine-protein kinase
MNMQSAEPKVQYRYRCSCGEEVLVHNQGETVCGACGRKITQEAVRCSNAATLSMVNLDSSSLSSPLEAPEVHSADDDAMIGQVYGHFEIVGHLGRGGMGTVYRALDQSLQRYVALKIVRRRQRNLLDSTQINRLMQEAVAQARLQHPNIVTIYYVGRKEDEPFLAMELVSGKTIAELIEKHSMSFASIVRAASQMVRALHHAANFDIVHADIKPSNMLISNDGDVKLADFGLARRLSESDENEKHVSGTPRYMAPELAKGDRPTIQSDMYSLGVSLFEMTFGRPPYTQKINTLKEVIDTHRTQPVEYPQIWPANIPEQWRSILDRLLAKAPSERYANYEQLMHDLIRVEPTTYVYAGRLPRVFAGVIDMLLYLLLALPLLAATQILENLSGIPDFSAKYLLISLMKMFVPVFALVLPLVFAYQRQSVGRHLLHLRVVDRHGFPPARRVFFLRSLVRFPWIWLMVLVGIFQLPENAWIPAFLFVPVMFFAFADFFTMLLLGEGRSIHDFIFRTRVILDTKHQSLWAG